MSLVDNDDVGLFAHNLKLIAHLLAAEIRMGEKF